LNDWPCTLTILRVVVGSVGPWGLLPGNRGAQEGTRGDNGPEFVSKVLDHWAYRNGVVLDFSRPGKPIDNCYVESFNGHFRPTDRCLIAAVGGEG
jgi:putative transposase